MDHPPDILDQPHFRAIFVSMLAVLTALFNPLGMPQDYLELGLYNM